MSQHALSFGVLLLISVNAELHAEALRYNIKPQQVVPYNVNIRVGTPSSQEIMKGVIVYTGLRADNDTLTLRYNGGLTKTTKSTARRSGPFRGPGRPGGPPIPRGPFDQPDFRGLVTSQTTIVIGHNGTVKSMTGDSQLPFLLGNAALIPFELLPEAAVTEWEDGSALTITSKSQDSRFGPRFGPFANANEDKVKSGGGEKVSYKITSDDGTLVTISRTYSLSSPAANKNETGFEMAGTGTWVFNRTLGLSESMKSEITLTIDGNNTTVKYPISVSWNHMTDEQYKAHQENVEKQQAEREARIAEMKAKAEAEKNAGPIDPKPMNPVFKRGTIFQLKSPVWQAAQRELKKLAGSRMTGVVKEDVDVLYQVGLLRAHKQSEVRTEAEKVWNKWKDSFEEHASDEQKAAVAAAVGEQPTLPMKEENPFVVEGDDDPKGMRTWSDKSGRFKIEGEFQELDGATVVLKNKDGKLVRVPKSRLSDSDQKLVDKLTK